MATFAVSYDLNNRKDYQSLWDALDELDSVKALRSFYLVAYEGASTGLKNHLAQFIDEDDYLMVVRFNSRPAFTTALAGTNAWIKRHFP